MYITSTGMVCPVGLNAEAACAAMRAGIAQFKELPFYDKQAEPLMGAVVPIPLGDYTQVTWRKDRLIEMLAGAISDCLKVLPPEPLDRIPLFVGLPELDRPESCHKLNDSMIEKVQQKIEVNFHPHLSQVISKGHTAGFEGLRVALETFQDPSVSACLVCGVDSYINVPSLLWLDRYWRLKTEDNSDGVIPGEAAAAVLLRRVPLKEDILATQVLGLGFGHEQANVLSDDPLLGLGLAQATRIALTKAGLQMHEVAFRISDVTGESYGFKEQVLTMARLMRQRREDFPIWHCSEFIGDTGAAAGVCQMIIVDDAFAKSYAPGASALCYSSAVGGDRASVVLCRKGT